MLEQAGGSGLGDEHFPLQNAFDHGISHSKRKKRKSHVHKHTHSQNISHTWNSIFKKMRESILKPFPDQGQYPSIFLCLCSSFTR